jgi:hypothetical protein
MVKKPKAKVVKTMDEFKKGELHSGSKAGPKVTSRKQAVAIGLNQQRKEDAMQNAGSKTSSAKPGKTDTNAMAFRNMKKPKKTRNPR